MNSKETPLVPVPAILRVGAAVVLAQCLVAFGYAVWLIVTNLRGDGGEAHDAALESASPAANFVGVGTAAFILLVFGFIAYHAARTLGRRPSGRGAIVLIESILIGVAIYMLRGGAPWMGVATAASAVVALVGIFHPDSVRYWAARYEERTRGW